MNVAAILKNVNRSLLHLTDSISTRIEDKLNREEPAIDAALFNGMTLEQILKKINVPGTSNFYVYSVKLATPRKIGITGDGSWEVVFDGSGNVSSGFKLSSTGVQAGTYNRVTVDEKGRVTHGELYESSSTSGDISAEQIKTGTLSTARLPFIPIQQGGGAGQSITKLYIGYNVTDKQLRLQVDATDHGSNWPINVTGKAATSDYATRAGSADSALRADSAGTATSAASATTAGSANTANTATKLATPRTITFTGDVTGSYTFDGSAAINASLSLPNLVSAGTYAKVTVNAKGLVTGSSALTAEDISGALKYTPANDANLKSMGRRNVFISTAAPTSADGENGDIWIQYI